MVRKWAMGAAALAMLTVSAPVLAAKGLPRVHGAMPAAVAPAVGRPLTNSLGRWSQKRDGRWMGGWNAPGGWSGYRAPARGYVLPGYWINPGFYIGNYSRYGFSVPQPGYGWSRYYDDAVLTDRDGRVYDSIRGVEWDRYADDEHYAGGEDFGDSYGYRDDRPSSPVRAKDRDGGLGGALVGGAVGAVAGNVIAGKGDRLAGSLIGGAVGAVAGAVVDKGDRAGRGYREERGYRDYDYDDRDVYRAPRKLKKKDRRFRHRDRDFDDGYASDRGRYDRGYHARGPHWGGGYGQPHVVYRSAGYGYGYGYGAPEVTVITVNSAPITTTTTTTTEEVIYSSAARKRVWRPAKKKVWKPRPRCACR